MSINGKKHSKRMLNVLKSILYYQNRVRREDPRCIISFPNAAVLSCPRRPSLILKRRLHLHLLVNLEARHDLNSTLADWGLDGVTWTMYSFEQHRVSETVQLITMVQYECASDI